MIVFNHIQKMLNQASYLAELATAPVIEHDSSAARDLQHRRLERAANLARHAAAELEDELLRSRDGWDQV